MKVSVGSVCRFLDLDCGAQCAQAAAHDVENQHLITAPPSDAAFLVHWPWAVVTVRHTKRLVVTQGRCFRWSYEKKKSRHLVGGKRRGDERHQCVGCQVQVRPADNDLARESPMATESDQQLSGRKLPIDQFSIHQLNRSCCHCRKREQVVSSPQGELRAVLPGLQALAV